MNGRSFVVRNIIMLIVIFIRAIFNIITTEELRKSLRVGVQFLWNGKWSVLCVYKFWTNLNCYNVLYKKPITNVCEMFTVWLLVVVQGSDPEGWISENFLMKSAMKLFYYLLKWSCCVIYLSLFINKGTYISWLNMFVF